MALDYSNFRVELRRHIGLMSSELGTIPVEHPQKIVLVYPPEVPPGHPICKQVGYLADVDGSPLLWLPEIKEEAPGKLQEWIEAEAYRLRAAGEFVDPPQ